MKKESFVIKGNIAFSENKNQITCIQDGYVVCVDGVCQGTFEKLPEEYKELPLKYYGKRLVIPGMTDLHVHAPQYTFRGLGMDLELLEWLDTNTFPEEAKYADINYARDAYSYFVEDLKNSYTTRAVVFATMHREATVELMNQLEESGLVSYVGKVNMDRNGGVDLQEENAEVSARETIKWLDEVEGRYKNTMPIITPRFTPSCTDELMKKLAVITRDRGLRVQSHLSENLSEIEWVKELVPEASCYGDAYRIFDMLGSTEAPAIMAHCVYCPDEEIDMLLEHGTYVAHCPECNMNVSSGIAPARKYLDKGLNIGLGSDVAGGTNLSLFQAMATASRASKIYWRLVDQEVKPLKFPEIFYMATLGGGSYFGKVGSFKKGYEFDALVIDDSKLKSMRQLSIEERLERMIYQEKSVELVAKFVDGCEIFGDR